jgi:hypothetical protein
MKTRLLKNNSEIWIEKNKNKNSKRILKFTN